MFDSVQKRAAAIARDGIKVRRLVQGCRKLLSERGEAAGVSLARTTLDQYRDLDRRSQARFFAALHAEFSPDPEQVLAASRDYAADPSAANLMRLGAVAEPPRQELLRRLNRAPGGTATILHMRERLLELKSEQRELEAVDADFRHLLASWFNPGFLQILRVDWHSPAYLLEQIIVHEAVHEIRGWNDLRRRLEVDRRCFAFFHPALPDEPLIFVEVALMDRMPDAVSPLLDAQAVAGDPGRATAAVFYSISNCQPGLRGVSLGNFLIKSVVEVLSREFPRLKLFCTLSPLPGFSAWLNRQLKRGEADPPCACAGAGVESRRHRARNRRHADRRRSRGCSRATGAPEGAVDCAVRHLSAARRRGGRCDQGGEATGATGAPGAAEPVEDPVARFHLHNGARLERINWLANVSRRGMRESLGLMVNFLYEPRSIEANHDRFVRGEIAASRQVRSQVLGD